MNPLRLRGLYSVERRRLLVGVGGLLGAAATWSAMARSPTGVAANTATRTFLRQQVDYAVGPDRIYAALTEADQFASFTGMAAQIDARPGGAFSLFDGLVGGWNLDLVPGQRIVQAWRLTKDFEEGVYSLVRFDLKPRDSGTRITLNHTGIPPGHYDHLYAGWPPRYWDPLRQFLESPKTADTH